MTQPGYALQLVAPPAEEPVSLAEIRVHLRLDDDEEGVESADLEEKVAAAREQFEKDARRQLVTATYKLICDRFPCGAGSFYLPRPPLQSVTEIRYRDVAGQWATMDADDYVVSAYRTPGTIRPAYGQSWPEIRCEADAVEITYVCGYGAASAVPALAKSAIKLLAGAWYANREEIVTGTNPLILPVGFSRIVARFDPLADFHPIGGG